MTNLTNGDIIIGYISYERMFFTMDTTLVVMAAGMGSRFGGLKQIAPLGPNGEIILDFSLYDAKEAGFNKAVFIIKKAIEKEFREVIGKRIEKMIDVSYVFQETDKIPEEFSSLKDREKPWGTGHAILCAKDEINTPFAVINADDYYGKEAYKLMHDSLVKNDNICMVGYKLYNTLTENGTVSRGVCEIEGGCLKSVTEHLALDKNSGFSEGTIVSMNMWGFTPKIFETLESDFNEFLKNLSNPLKEEFLLPVVVDRLIKNKGEKAIVIPTSEKWYGVTYKEDAAPVSEALKNMVDKGLYNGI